MDVALGKKNAQLAIQAQKQLEQELLSWVADKVPQHTQDIENNKNTWLLLKTGIILCDLANALRPGSIDKIWPAKHGFKHVDNINKFHAFCMKQGIPKSQMFETRELYDNENMSTVINSLVYFKKFMSGDISVDKLAKKSDIPIKPQASAAIQSSSKPSSPQIETGKGSSVTQSTTQKEPEKSTQGFSVQQSFTAKPTQEQNTSQPSLQKEPAKTSNQPTQGSSVQQSSTQKEPTQARNTSQPSLQKEPANLSTQGSSVVQSSTHKEPVKPSTQTHNISQTSIQKEPVKPSTHAHKDVISIKHNLTQSASSGHHHPDNHHISKSVSVPTSDSTKKLSDSIVARKANFMRSFETLSKFQAPALKLEEHVIAGLSSPRVDKESEEKRKEKEKERATNLVPKLEKANSVRDEKRKEKKMREEQEKAAKLKRIEKAKSVAGSVFKNVGKEPGIEMWRIEQFEAAPWPKEQHGKLFSGDSYIVLHTIRERGPYNIYYWLGSESSTDEIGTAAHKVVELSAKLGGDVVHFRETEFYETPRFMSLFPGGIEHMAGGTEGAFHHVDDFHESKLLHCKGRRNVRIVPVEVSYKSMNSGDVFILDAGKKIWQWNGKDSSRRERSKGLQMIRKIREDRGHRPLIEVIEQGEEPDDFWVSLGSAGPIASADEVESDDYYEKIHEYDLKLYRVSDESGEMKITLEATSPLKQTMLQSKDCFILDAGVQVFSWIGRDCTPQERAKATIEAEALLKGAEHPNWAPLTIMVEGTETPLFKEQFSEWRDIPGLTNFNPADWINRDAFIKDSTAPLEVLVEDKKIDIDSLINSKSEDYDPFALYYDLKGKTDIWRIENFTAKPLPKKEYGVFYSGDSYIVMFTPDWKKIKPLLYYWLGRSSTQDERGASAILSSEKSRGEATHIRVVQGKEPAHFLSLFNGKFVVLLGGIASGFHNVDEQDIFLDEKEAQLFHIHGTKTSNTRAIQIECDAKDLNSSDAFILNTPKTQFIWFGNGCIDVEKEIAITTAEYLRSGSSKKVTEIKEGSEPDEFWEFLGGKQPYANFPELKEQVREPRLFHCSNAKGFFDVEEIYNFTQDDLMMDDVYILDIYTTVFVWVGNESNHEEKMKSIEMAIDYVDKQAERGNRQKDQPIIRVLAGSEPSMFTCWFHAWNKDKAGSDTYSRYVKKHRPEPEIKKPVLADARVILANSKRIANHQVIIPYKELILDPPNKKYQDESIDRSSLEKYLSVDEFESIFKMTRLEFYQLPPWKQENLKSAVKLY